jgi:hypothetical protein
MKKTYSEIIELLVEHCPNLYEWYGEDFDYKLLESLLGKWTEIHVSGGCDKGSDWVRVYYFQDHDVYIELNGYYTSYDGVNFNQETWVGSDVREVRPFEVIQTIYK